MKRDLYKVIDEMLSTIPRCDETCPDKKLVENLENARYLIEFFSNQETIWVYWGTVGTILQDYFDEVDVASQDWVKDLLNIWRGPQYNLVSNVGGVTIDSWSKDFGRKE